MDISFKPLHETDSDGTGSTKSDKTKQIVKLDKPIIAEWHGVLKACTSYEHTLRVSFLRKGSPLSESFRPYNENKSTHQFLAFYRERPDYRSLLEKEKGPQILFFFEADVGSELFDAIAKLPPGGRGAALDVAIAANDRCAMHIANTLATSMMSMPSSRSYKLIHWPKENQENIARRKLDPMPFKDDGTLDLEYYWLIIFENSYRNCPHKQKERSLLNVRHHA